jgi:hypothetical protein
LFDAFMICHIPPLADAVVVDRIRRVQSSVGAAATAATAASNVSLSLSPDSGLDGCCTNNRDDGNSVQQCRTEIAVAVNKDSAVATTKRVIPIECITCKVRLSIPLVLGIHNGPFGETRINSSPCPAATAAFWTLQALNSHGDPTVQMPQHAAAAAAVSVTTAAASHNSVPHHDDDDFHPHDEFYMVYHYHKHAIKGNRPVAIALWEHCETSVLQGDDNINSTAAPSLVVPLYRVEWVSSPMNFHAARMDNPEQDNHALVMVPDQSTWGHVSIHFCYTAGMGGLPPPTKQGWCHGGATQTCYLHRQVPPPWATTAWSSSGTTNNTTTVPPAWRIFAPPQPRLDLSLRHDVILAFGDSVLEQLVSSSSSIVFGEKVAMPLLTRTVPMLLESLEQSLGQHLLAEHLSNAKVALILNSALWNVLSDEATVECKESVSPSSSSTIDPWENHLDALAEFLTQVLQRYGNVQSKTHAHSEKQHPLRLHVTVYWMLPTAVHIHRVHLADSDAMRQRAPQKINRTRYMSASRTRQLYLRQKQVVEPLLAAQQRQVNQAEGCSLDAAVDSHYFLDVYEATYLSADWTLPGDGRHYRPELNQKMLSWFL